MGPGERESYTTRKSLARVTSLTWVKSNHTFKFGGEWRKDAMTDRKRAWQPGHSELQRESDFLALEPESQRRIVGFPYASFLLGHGGQRHVSTPQDPQFLKVSWGVVRTGQLEGDAAAHLELRRPLRLSGRFARVVGSHRRLSTPTCRNPSRAICSAGCVCRVWRQALQLPVRQDLSVRVPTAAGFAFQFDDKTVIRGGWGLTYGQTANFGYISNVPIVGVGFNQPALQPARDWRTRIHLARRHAVQDGRALRRLPRSGHSSILQGRSTLLTYWLDPNGGRPPRIYQWSFSVQRELTKDLWSKPATLATAAYGSSPPRSTT